MVQTSPVTAQCGGWVVIEDITALYFWQEEIARRIAVKITPRLLPQREVANNQSVRRHLDAFTRGRIIGKLEEGRSVTRCGCRVRNYSQHRFTTLETISNYGNSYLGVRVVVVHEEPHPQMTGTLSYRPEETGGRQREKSLDTRHRRLDDRYRGFYRGQKTARWWSVCTTPCTVCTFNACPSEKAFSVCAGNTGIGETMNGDEYSLQMRADSV
ncbi:hypothetical protein TNCV_1672691 [Trichonephila clavipes]|nr:hypothetical protein TNCV_1672691 [Trichonephila clavipes]